MSEIDSTLRKDIQAMNESSGKITPVKADDSREQLPQMNKEADPV